MLMTEGWIPKKNVNHKNGGKRQRVRQKTGRIDQIRKTIEMRGEK